MRIEIVTAHKTTINDREHKKIIKIEKACWGK